MGRTHSQGGEGGGGSIFWKTQDTALYSTYIESSLYAGIRGTNENLDFGSFIMQSTLELSTRVVKEESVEVKYYFIDLVNL